MSEEQTYSATAEVGQVRQRRSRMQRIWVDLKNAPPTAWFGMIVILIYAIVAIFAPLIAPFGEADASFSAYQQWGDGHVFGTDQIGRDIFSRLIYGARNTVGIALATTLLAFAIGGSLGLMAAISQNWPSAVPDAICQTWTRKLVGLWPDADMRSNGARLQRGVSAP